MYFSYITFICNFVNILYLCYSLTNFINISFILTCNGCRYVESSRQVPVNNFIFISWNCNDDRTTLGIISWPSPEYNIPPVKIAELQCCCRFIGFWCYSRSSQVIRDSIIQIRECPSHPSGLNNNEKKAISSLLVSPGSTCFKLC